MAWVNLNEVVTTWPPTGGVTATVGDLVWTVDTFTELRAIATTDVDDISAIVRVGGGSTVGDGGGGDFYWDATSADADDNGITILPTGYAGTGRWKRNNFNEIIFGGLKAFVPAFSLIDKAGAEFLFPEGSIALQASLEQHVYVDLFDKTLHVLRHNVHRGGILLASVTTDASGVVRSATYKPQFPKARLGKTLAKLRSTYGRVAVGTMGDSLTDGAAATPFWRNLLFDSATTPTTWKIPKVTSGLTVNANYAIGGATAHLGFMQTARSIYGAESGAFWTDTQLCYGPIYSGRNFSPGHHAVAESSIYKKDLVIIGFGQNGGSEPLETMEKIIRKLRERDIDVIIQTQNQTSTDITANESNIKTLAAIAEQYGAELADTWSYMREAYDNGSSILADSVHQSVTGHELYAKAIRSVLHDWSVDTEAMFNPHRAIGGAVDQVTQDIQHNSAYVIFTPIATTGVNGALASPPAVPKNPAADFGGLTNATSCTILTTGQYAEYGCSMVGGVNIIVDATAASTLEVRKENGAALVNTITIGAVGRMEIKEALSAGQNISNGASAAETGGITSDTLRFTCTSGTARIIGMVAHTHAFEEIPFGDMVEVGTWTNDTWSYGHDYARYTDTTNDYIDIPFVGTGIEVLLSKKSAAGIVAIYLDGILHTSALDLYSTGTYAYPFVVFADSTYLSRGYGQHVLTIKLTGANASAIAPVATNRRLCVLGAYELDAR